MIIFMVLVMVSKCIWHAFNAYNALHPDYWHSNPILYNVLGFIPSSMLSIACSINVRNWIFYFIRIKEAAFARKRSLEYDEQNEQRLQSFHKRTKVFILELKIGIIIFFVVTGVSLVYIIYISFFT